MHDERRDSARAGDNAARGEQVAAIARDYLQAGLPVRKILERYELTTGRFYEIVEENGWKKRRPPRPRSLKVDADGSAALIARLRKLASRRIAALERAAGDEETDLAGHERLAKALSALLVLLTRIDELETAGGGGNAATKAVMTPEEADERRQKLAQMLVAMLEQASGQRLPERG